VDRRKALSWLGPLGILAAWLIVFWTWYVFALGLELSASRTMMASHLSQDQMMAAVERHFALTSALRLVAFPIVALALLWITWGVRVWRWSTGQTLGFVFMSAAAALAVWYIANRVAPMRVIVDAVGVAGNSQSTTRDYMGNPLGDRLAFVAVPLMLITTFVARWWSRWRLRHGLTPTPTTPGSWRGRDVGLLWAAIAAVEVALVGLVRIAPMGPATPLWLLPLPEWIFEAFVTIPCLGVVATLWWLIARGRYPAQPSALP
jgi:hypothetical protein